MEGIVTKLLGAYLNKFIKGFNKEMLSLQIMKGQATMKDFGTELFRFVRIVNRFVRIEWGGIAGVNYGSTQS